MWYVYEKCNVYGEDCGEEFEYYVDALKYYKEASKSEPVCRGYVTLYLFEIIKSIDNPLKDSSEYDFIEETCELVKTDNPRIRLLTDGIKEYGQYWKKGDIGVVTGDYWHTICFSINGITHSIHKGHPMYDGEYEFITK